MTSKRKTKRAKSTLNKQHQEPNGEIRKPSIHMIRISDREARKSALPFVVYARATTLADQYFEKLQQEDEIRNSESDIDWERRVLTLAQRIPRPWPPWFNEPRPPIPKGPAGPAAPPPRMNRLGMTMKFTPAVLRIEL